MKLKMAEKSLFAMLLRSPWWMSIGTAVLIGLIARIVLPSEYEIYALFSGIPFVVIGVMAAWKQLRAPRAAHVADTLHAAASLSWSGFSAAVEQAFRRDGHAVTRLDGSAADFELVKAGRTTLVSCKRWKAVRIGVEPLRELHVLRDKRDASAAIYIGLGTLTDNARAFASEHRVQVLQGVELAVLLRGVISAPATRP